MHIITINPDIQLIIVKNINNIVKVPFKQEFIKFIIDCIINMYPPIYKANQLLTINTIIVI